MKFRDYYETMGLERTASADDIKRAYRRLARKYHPDVSKEADAEVRFKEMKEAYEVLKDPEKRSAYDKFGENWQTGQEFKPPPDWQQSRSGGPDDIGGSADYSDFFDAMFGGRGGFRQHVRSQGEDVRAQISISLEDAYTGATRQISLDVVEPDDKGQPVRRRKALNVKIPAGIRAGQQIRLQNQGSPGFGENAAAGDLYLRVDFAPHRYFSARDRDVHIKLPVAPWEAALGRTVQVPTLDGAVKLKIPPGSSSGKVLRLRGRGLPGEPAGDQYVELELALPDSIDERAKELYAELERDNPFNPREAMGV